MIPYPSNIHGYHFSIAYQNCYPLNERFHQDLSYDAVLTYDKASLVPVLYPS